MDDYRFFAVITFLVSLFGIVWSIRLLMSRKYSGWKMRTLRYVACFIVTLTIMTGLGLFGAFTYSVTWSEYAVGLLGLFVLFTLLAIPYMFLSWGAYKLSKLIKRRKEQNG
jgi:hypothetical protein